MAVSRDISRSRKAYSFYRPRPIVRAVTTEEEMISVNAALNSINSLATQVANLQASSDNMQANSDNIVWNEIPTGTVNGVNKVFTLAYTPEATDKILVFVNGVLKEQDAGEADYTISGSTITFVDAPMEYSKIMVTYAKA